MVYGQCIVYTEYSATEYWVTRKRKVNYFIPIADESDPEKNKGLGEAWVLGPAWILILTELFLE